MKPILFAAVALLAATPALAGGLVSVQRPETQTDGKLTVSSPSFNPGQAIARRYSGYGESLSPALSWSAAPKAKSYAVLVDDPDGPAAEPVSHWVDWNIPASVTRLGEGQKLGLQGTNSHKGQGYTGPHPPAADPAHHYHFQVLALDTMLDTPAGADRAAVLAAAKGHVIAKGEVVGTFEAPKT